MAGLLLYQPAEAKCQYQHMTMVLNTESTHSTSVTVKTSTCWTQCSETAHGPHFKINTLILIYSKSIHGLELDVNMGDALS